MKDGNKVGVMMQDDNQITFLRLRTAKLVVKLNLRMKTCGCLKS